MQAPESSASLHLFRDLCGTEAAARLKEMLPPAKAQALGADAARLFLETAIAMGSFEGLAVLEPILTPELLTPAGDSYLTMALIHAAKRELIGTAPVADASSRDERVAAFLVRLIQLGAPPSGFKGQLRSPLGCSLRRGLLVSEALMNHGAIPSPDDLRLAIDWSRPDALTLMLAIKKPDSKLLAQLASRAEGRASSDCLSAVLAFQERRALAGILRRKAAPAPPRRM